MLSENLCACLCILEQVAEKFLAYVRDSSSQQQRMSFFISYYVEDILMQATESTLRYERGAHY